MRELKKKIAMFIAFTLVITSMAFDFGNVKATEGSIDAYTYFRIGTELIPGRDYYLLGPSYNDEVYIGQMSIGGVVHITASGPAISTSNSFPRTDLQEGALFGATNLGVAYENTSNNVASGTALTLHNGDVVYSPAISHNPSVFGDSCTSGTLFYVEHANFTSGQSKTYTDYTGWIYYCTGGGAQRIPVNMYEKIEEEEVAPENFTLVPAHDLYVYPDGTPITLKPEDVKVSVNVKGHEFVIHDATSFTFIDNEISKDDNHVSVRYNGVDISLEATLHSPLSQSGTVTDKSGNPLPNMRVTITDKYGKVSDTVLTDSDGNYTIPDIIPGNSRVVIADGDDFTMVLNKEITAASSTECTPLNIEVATGPDEKAAGDMISQVISQGEAPAATSTGMSELLINPDKTVKNQYGSTVKVLNPTEQAAIEAGNASVEFVLIIDEDDEDSPQGSDINTKFEADLRTAGFSGASGIEFFTIDITKIYTDHVYPVNNSTTNIIELQDPIDIYVDIPADLKGKEDYVMYRHHDGAVEEISNDPSDPEYFEVLPGAERVKIHSKKYCSYAIAATWPKTYDLSTPVEKFNAITNKITFVKPDEKTKVVYEILPKGAKAPVITWESLDPKVATVDEDGVVSAVGYGSTTIVGTTPEGLKIEIPVTFLEISPVAEDPSESETDAVVKDMIKYINANVPNVSDTSKKDLFENIAKTASENYDGTAEVIFYDIVPATTDKDGSIIIQYEIKNGDNVRHITYTFKLPMLEGSSKPFGKYLPILIATGVGNKSSIDLTWLENKLADGYDVFYAECGTNDYSLLKSTSKTTYTHKVKASDAYKYVVLSYKLVDGNKVYLQRSTKIHVALAGHKKTNAKEVKVDKAKINLTVGGSVLIKAKTVKLDTKKKLLSHTAEFRYFIVDRKIVSVSATGEVTAKKAGKTDVYVLSNNGQYKKVTVTVK